MNGCHNRPDFVQTIEMQDGWKKTERFITDDSVREAMLRNVPFAMSRRCEYTRSDLGQADAGCLGCRHRSNVKEEK